MASTSKRMRYEISDVLDTVDKIEDDNGPGGMSGSEESEMDREFGSSDDEWSDEPDDKDLDKDDCEVRDTGEVGDTGDASGSADVGDTGDVSEAADVGDTGVVSEAADVGDTAEVGESGNSSRSLDSGSEDESRGSGRGHSGSSGRGKGRGHGWGRGRGRGRGHGRGRGGHNGGSSGSSKGGGCENPQYITKSYEDPDIDNNLPAFTPTRPPGIHFDHALLRGTMTTAIEFFKLFFTSEMINSIVTHTNSNAYIKIAGGSHASYTNRDGSWQDATSDEINRLIAFLIYAGLVKVGSDFAKYWSTQSIYHGLWARRILSRDRFRALMAFLHVVDPCDETPGNKLRKVESFLNYFKKRCSQLYQPSQNMAVDERMIKSRHMSGIRQYIKDKPIKWGIKLWVLADSLNGYTVDFDVYIGKSASGDFSVNGLGYDVVMKLVRPYFDQGYHLYFDNFYTSYALVHDLLARGTPSTGTTKVNRQGFPVCLKDVEKWSKKKARGSMRWERVNNVLALQWVDNKTVSLLTTIDNANDNNTIKRKTKTGGVYREIEVMQPEAIARYNRYMNGVDRSDQILTANNVARKCYKWWKALFFHLIDMAIVNSFIIFKQHMANFPDIEELQRSKYYTFVDFREELVRQLCGFDKYDVPPASSRVQPVHDYGTIHIPEFAEIRKSCYVCSRAGLGQLRVSTYCSAPQCGKFLHIAKEKNCFKEWHSKKYHNK